MENIFRLDESGTATKMTVCVFHIVGLKTFEISADRTKSPYSIGLGFIELAGKIKC